MSRASLSALLVVLIVVGLAHCAPETCSPEDGTCQQEADDADCKDLNDQCLRWAEHGECKSNAEFMANSCQQSCELCSSTRVPDWENDDCEDLHPKCSEWAGHGECVSNPGYMLMGCKKSCFKCMNVKRDREEGVEEEEM